MIELTTTDDKVRELVKRTVTNIKKQDLERDWKGEWFSNSQLGNLREVYERHGYETARVYLAGKLERRGNRFERLRNELLLQLIKDAEGIKLDVRITSYIIGKLNSVLQEELKSAKEVKR